jgi:hypothetical protein
MRTINGQTETEYLLGAIEVLRRELSTSHNKLEVMERIDSLKDCLIAVLTNK